MENAGYLFAAYAIVWAVVFGYVLLLLNRQRGLRREIDSLKEALKEKGETSEKADLELDISARETRRKKRRIER